MRGEFQSWPLYGYFTMTIMFIETDNTPKVDIPSLFKNNQVNRVQYIVRKSNNYFKRHLEGWLSSDLWVQI